MSEHVVTPDDKMSMPIDRMLFWAAHVVYRTLKYSKLPSRVLESDMAQRIMKKEDEFVRAYRTAIMARASEVVAYCNSIGLVNGTVELVRQKPFEIACAVDRFLNGADEEIDGPED